MDKMVLYWLIVIIVGILIEICTFQLISIWFAVGAFISIPFAVFHAPAWIQFIVFFVASGFSMYLIKPLAKKHFKPKESRSMVGMELVLTEDCDQSKGKIKVRDVEWLIRSEEPIPKGTTVTVTRVEGVKLIVQEK